MRLYQPRRGYRFSIDSILLGRFCGARAGERVLDLGAGCGIVSLMIAALGHPREIVAIEMQPALAAIAVRNAALNHFDDMRVICADLEALSASETGGEFDLVVANPPFRARQTGRESPDTGRRIARTETTATLAGFVAAAARNTRRGGRAAFVLAAVRSAELLSALRSAALEPKRVRFVHPFATARASVILVEARKGGGIEVEIEAPLMLYTAPGVYTAEALALMGAA